MKMFVKACAACFCALLFLLLTGCNGASEIARERLDKDGNTGFLTKTLHRGWWTRKYAVFIPKSYRPGTLQKYPVIIFLHGMGEGSGFGEGDLKNLTVGIGPAVARKAETFDFIVIFPQSDGSWSPGSDYTTDMFTALANTAREYPIDPERVYLTGLSTGGYGTWAIAAAHPGDFAAIVPMGSNGSNYSGASALTHMAVRAYCSMFGDMFAGWNDHGMVNKIKEIDPSANAQFIATPTLGHDCWENVYGGDELYDWLKKQHREGARAQISSPTSPPVSPPTTPSSPRSAQLDVAPVTRAEPLRKPVGSSLKPPQPLPVTAVKSVSPPPSGPVQTPTGPSVPAVIIRNDDPRAWMNTPW